MNEKTTKAVSDVSVGCLYLLYTAVAAVVVGAAAGAMVRVFMLVSGM